MTLRFFLPLEVLVLPDADLLSEAAPRLPVATGLSLSASSSSSSSARTNDNEEDKKEDKKEVKYHLRYRE